MTTMQMAAVTAAAEEDAAWRWLTLQLAVAAVVAASLLRVTAPYGRHASAAWQGPSIAAKKAWLLMESPALVYSLLVFSGGDHARQAAPLVIFAPFVAHYFHRVIVYPLRMRPSRGVPLLIVALSFAFNTFNAYVQARWVSHIGRYDADWLRTLRFRGGAAIFLSGAAINIWADSVLISLRATSKAAGSDDSSESSTESSSASSSSCSAYKLPRAGLFKLIACPNYGGEVLEWLGWAILTWSPAGFAFFAFTAANLVPRAMAHRRWYAANFPQEFDPLVTRAIIPFLL